MPDQINIIKPGADDKPEVILLSSRLEALTEPCSQMDVEIFCRFVIKKEFVRCHPTLDIFYFREENDLTEKLGIQANRFTESLDAITEQISKDLPYFRPMTGHSTFDEDLRYYVNLISAPMFDKSVSGNHERLSIAYCIAYAKAMEARDV